MLPQAKKRVSESPRYAGSSRARIIFYRGLTVDESMLRRLIAGGESGTVEFKIKAPRPAEIAERMCGMANSRTGGVIIFGVADSGEQIVGLRNPNQSIDLALRAARMIKPPLTFVGAGPLTCTVDGLSLVIAEIAANDGTLYQSSGVFWIRKGSHTIPMSSDEIAAHLHNSGAIRWEQGIHPRATLDAIDRDQIERYLALRATRRIDLRYTSWEELLLGMQCAARDPQTGEVRPTNVGLLMFGRDPQWFIPQSEVVCIRYADRLGVRTYVNRLNLTLIRERGSITSSEYKEATGASERTALRELRNLVERAIIVVRGRTRSARYYLP